MAKTKTRMEAFGKWFRILGHLGFAELLDGKHQDCPICGAKRNFRYTDYKSNGEWICTCGQGDGFDLIQRVNGWEFKYAAKEVDHIIGNNDLAETFQPKVDYEQRRKNLNKLWAGAQDDSIVREYLKSRGISEHMGFNMNMLRDLRGHPAMYNTDSGKRQPGMCALIRNKAGDPVSIHRTFFDPRAKKIMPPTEKISGAGVRLGWRSASEESGTIVIGEGIETTLAGMAEIRVPGMAAISAHGMETIFVPKEFTRVIILSDNDRSFTGQKAAFTLARRMDSEKRYTQVLMPHVWGKDFLDMVNAGETYDNWSNERGTG